MIMNFGKWIFVSFVLFAIFIGVLVTICVRQDVSLVSGNYYQEELMHQAKIDQQANTKTLTVVPEITLTGNEVDVYFPLFSRMEKGELRLLRPSDQRLDQNFQLKTSADSLQRFTLSVSDRGLYRASMRWTMGGKDYYIEKLLVK